MEWEEVVLRAGAFTETHVHTFEVVAGMLMAGLGQLGPKTALEDGQA